MKNVILFLLTVITIGAFAQKIKVVEGNLKSLQNEKAILTEFVYDGMTIGTKQQREADYITKKKTDYNEKEAGRGDTWEKAWVDDRQARYEPSFNELFEQYAKVSTKGNAKYKLIFKTTRTEPGYRIGPFIGGHAPARIDAEVTIVEIANPSNVIAKIEIINAPGRDAVGFDYDTGYRIQEAYAKSGKELGKLLH